MVTTDGDADKVGEDVDEAEEDAPAVPDTVPTPVR
jgi:hypothetical protein